ncbi:MAG: DUF883 family protein [Pseudomonadota bacterium]
MSGDTDDTLREARERLAGDLRNVIDDAEALLRHAVRDAGQGYDEARARLEARLKAARAGLADAQDAALDGVRGARRAAGGYVRQHPWESIGIGAGIGLLVGLLVGRR